MKMKSNVSVLRPVKTDSSLIDDLDSSYSHLEVGQSEEIEFLKSYAPKSISNFSENSNENVSVSLSSSVLLSQSNFGARRGVRRLIERCLKRSKTVLLAGTACVVILAIAIPTLRWAGQVAPTERNQKQIAAGPIKLPALELSPQERVTIIAKVARAPEPERGMPLPASMALTPSIEAATLRERFATSGLHTSIIQELGASPITFASAPITIWDNQATKTEIHENVPVITKSLNVATATRKYDAFIARGEQLLTTGEIISARLFFEKAAAEGDPRAARGMAKTYDPKVLRTLPVVGLSGSQAEADRWYAKAAELSAQRSRARTDVAETGE